MASRGEISFQEAADHEAGRVGLDVSHGRADPAAAAIASTRPLGAAEAGALEDLRRLGRGKPDGYLVGSTLQKFSGSVTGFYAALERQVIAGGWYAESPRISRNRWLGRAILEIVAGVVVWFVAAFIVSSGLGLVGLAIIAGGILTFMLAFSMPAKTMAGAMVQAMLAAYRRTLAKTMATARSLNQVVAEAQLPWLRTPDQAMVWATAVGLSSELEDVLGRSLADVRQNEALASSTYFPAWYVASSAAHAGGLGIAAGDAQPRGGLFSGSMAPNFGGMLAALGTIGNPPPSTGSSSSGGSSSSSGGSFGGGSSGGGGGGAGGGF